MLLNAKYIILVQYNALISLLNAAICSPVTLLIPIVIRPLTEVCQENVTEFIAFLLKKNCSLILYVPRKFIFFFSLIVFIRVHN